jgi:hypothetical protein
MEPADAIQRKLRGLSAILQDGTVTAAEKENARALKLRLEKKLRREGVAKGDWTDIAFRAGQTVQGLKQATAPPPASTGASRLAFRLGKALGQGIKKWRSA